MENIQIAKSGPENLPGGLNRGRRYSLAMLAPTIYTERLGLDPTQIGPHLAGPQARTGGGAGVWRGAVHLVQGFYMTARPLRVINGAIRV
jgi:hypothetical protein